MLAVVIACSSLVDITWQLTLQLGRGNPAGFLSPPLAMFTPGGGRAEYASWLGSDWAEPGERLSVPLELEFFDTDFGHVSEEPLRRVRARKCFVRCSDTQRLDTRAEGVAWGLVELSSIEALLVWTLDLPEGTCRASESGVSLPAGTRLYCSSQVWQGDELQRLLPLRTKLRAELAALPNTATSEARRTLERRVRSLEHGLPRDGAPTVAVPWESGRNLQISTHGQLAVHRLVSAKCFNPFENGGKLPFGRIPQFGVVGSFELRPPTEGQDSYAQLEYDGRTGVQVEVVV